MANITNNFMKIIFHKVLPMVILLKPFKIKTIYLHRLRQYHRFPSIIQYILQNYSKQFLQYQHQSKAKKHFITVSLHDSHIYPKTCTMVKNNYH